MRFTWPRNRAPTAGPVALGAAVAVLALDVKIQPGLQVLDGVDDATAEFVIGRAGSIGAVLLKRTARQA